MKKLFPLIFILTLSFSAKSQTNPVSYTESGFIAAFPIKPVTEKKEIESKLGKIQITSFQCEGEDYVILVSENKYAVEAADKIGDSGAKGMINGAKNGAIKNLESQLGAKFNKITDEDYLFNDKYLANKSLGSISGIDIKTICIMKGNQLYLIITMGNIESEIVDSFSKSFSFIENK